jgi:hypothetical protein
MPWRGAYRPCPSRDRAHALHVGHLWMEAARAAWRTHHQAGCGGAGAPGNIQRPAEIVGETVDAVTIRLKGTTMAIAPHSEQPIERAFIDHTFMGGSTLFPRDQIASYAAALNPIPARLLLERRNVAGSQLRVVDFSKFRGKPVLVLTGTNDLGHARAVDEPIVDWLNANGAEADFILPRRPRYHRQRPHADAGAQQRRPCAVDHRLDRVLAEGRGVRAREKTPCFKI